MSPVECIIAQTLPQIYGEHSLLTRGSCELNDTFGGMEQWRTAAVDAMIDVYGRDLFSADAITRRCIEDDEMHLGVRCSGILGHPTIYLAIARAAVHSAIGLPAPQRSQ